MINEKQTYLSPETETLVIRFEGMVCTSPGAPGGKEDLIDGGDF